MSKEPQPQHARDRFTTVFKRHASKLQFFLYSRLKNEADAQDLAQEAYLRLMRVKKPDLINDPEAYLYRIAINLVSEHALKPASRLASETIDELGENDVDDNGETFEKTLERRADIMQLEKILDELPPLYQAALLLRKRDGYSRDEIAEKLNLAPSTVHTYLKRAVAHCRARWAEQK